jgi:hypothetical protein
MIILPLSVAVLLLGGRASTDQWYVLETPSTAAPDGLVQASLSCEPQSRPVCPEAAWLSINEGYESTDGTHRVRTVAVSGAVFTRSNGRVVHRIGQGKWKRLLKSRAETAFLQLTLERLGPTSTTARLSASVVSSRGIFPLLCGEHEFVLTRGPSGWTCAPSQ